MKAWAFLSIAILSETIATLALKSSEGFTRLWPSVAVVTGYAAAFFFLSHTLKEIPVGIAYAVWAGIGLVLITLADWLFFEQKIDGPALIGISLIVSGVIVLNLYSQSTAH